MNQACVITLVGGSVIYLSDFLHELPYYCDENILFYLDDHTYEAKPCNANEFCLEYGQDKYGQTIGVMNSADNLRRFIYETGDVVKDLGVSHGKNTYIVYMKDGKEMSFSNARPYLTNGNGLVIYSKSGDDVLATIPADSFTKCVLI